MQVESRIRRYPLSNIIAFTTAEMRLYRGAGWKLARFVNGEAVEFFDPLSVSYQPDVHAMAEASIKEAISWMQSNAAGEIWLGMCSCGQFCDPRRVRTDDVSSLARMARTFGDALSRAFGA